jgi:hypothetical protein
MNRFKIGLIPVLLLDDIDSGGGGGEMSGGDGGSSPAQTTQVSSSGSTAPSPIDLAEDALIRIKGQEKPVKFNEYFKGFQSQFTKASQEAARLKAALQEREQRLKQYETERQRASQQQTAQNPQNDVYAQLEQLPYLSGKDARAVVESIQGAITQRDQVLIAALKKIQTMEKMVSGLSENHSMQNFEGKISRWLQDGGYDPGYGDLAKEIYLAYEGDDLDNEFPQIFASRVKQIEDIWEKTRAAKVNAARQQRSPFVPGKGGQTGPSNPLKLDPRASHREVADQLWDAIQDGPKT